MKRIILILIALVAFGATTNAQSVVKVDAKTYQATKASRSSSSYEATDMTYIHTDGVKYTIYKHTFTKGKRAGQTGYFIKMTSKKTGKNYWKEVKLS